MILIDASKTYQRIDGFGVFVPNHSSEYACIYSRPFFDTLIDDLGCSIIRIFFLTQSGYAPDEEMLGMQIRDLSEMRAINPGLKIIASIESPPDVFKDGSGRLDIKCEHDFGTYLLDMCDTFSKQSIPIYALGLQNEPIRNRACKYDEESYYSMFRTICRLKEQRGNRVKLIANEDRLIFSNSIKKVIDKIDSDDLARSALDIVAVNGYIDTSWIFLTQARRNNPSAKLKDLYNYAYQEFFSSVGCYGRPSWIIQACDEHKNWRYDVNYDKTPYVRSAEYVFPLPTGALDLALKICYALNNGFGSYVYWLASTMPLVNFDDPTSALCEVGAKTLKYHAAKHFFKYIEPGMTRIESLSDSATVSAFKSDERLVVVLLNVNDNILDTSIQICGADVGHYVSYTSVENESHFKETGVLSGNQIPLTMLPNSIVTIVLD